MTSSPKPSSNSPGNSKKVRDPDAELPPSCRGAVFDPKTRKLEIREFDLAAPEPEEAIVRVASSAICGSDIHTFLGHRTPEGPLILGHEICGVVSRLGENLSRDAAGEPLAPGDRVTWSVAASCGHCFYCGDGLPQKCATLFKYGHESVDTLPPLNGGFADFIYLAPGSAIYKIPDSLEFDQVVFANCAMATVAAAHRTANIRPGQAVLIQGAGLLGLCAAALASASGCRAVLVTDTFPERLKLAREFGATHILRVDEAGPGGLEAFSREVAGSYGFDAAIEVCGHPPAVAEALPALKQGAAYALAGCVFPGALAEIDLRLVTTRLLRLSGVHNYAPGDLLTALRFLEAHHDRFSFNRVVGKSFPLARIAEAFDYAIANKDVLRVAVKP